MLFSYKWLQEYVDGLPESQAFMEQLTMKSVEVEEVIEGANDLGNVVVAEVLEAKKHPNADSLNIGLFNVGEAEPRQIVFGGKAVLQPGMKIPVALAPTTIPGGIKIKKSKLRGETSNGMCCTNKELGILDREDTVTQFGEDVLPGTPVVGLIPAAQTVIDIDNKSMTHRADLFSHIGMAREVAAAFNVHASLPAWPSLPKAPETISVTVEDVVACPQYIAVEMNVQQTRTPDFIAERLAACGISSISCIVDITNYVMLEYGNPLHAFDADVLGNSIIVRRATKGEKLVTLDHDEKELDERVLVIANESAPLAIAGVIGGEQSGISDHTKRIVLEAANFNAIDIRKAGQLVGVHTDSRLRYEKGQHPQLSEIAAARAVELLIEHAGAEVVGITKSAAATADEATVMLPAEQLERVSGMEWKDADVQSVLERLGCRVKVKGRGVRRTFVVHVPWWRTDLRIPEDVIEEVARLHGLEKIPHHELVAPSATPHRDQSLGMVRELRQLLARYGGTEVYNYSFYGAELAQRAGIDVESTNHIEILNPLSEDLAYLRQSYLPRLLEVLERNNARQEMFLFEMGNLYTHSSESTGMALMMRGDQAFRKLRGIVEQLLDSIGVNATYAASDAEGVYVLGAGELVKVTPVQQTAIELFGIEQEVAYATINIAAVAQHRAAQRLAPLSEFPAITIDLSFLMPKTLAWGEVESVIRKRAGDLLQNLEVFDVFTDPQGKKLDADKKSIAVTLTFQAQNRTLEMTEIEALRNIIVEELQPKEVTLREV